MSTFPPSRPRIRTEHPGIFRRGNRWAVLYRDAEGILRNKAAVSLGEALKVQERIVREKDPVRADLLRQKRLARVRTKADLEDAYGYIRQALQAIDRAPHVRGLGATRKRAVAALHEAEDHITEAIRSSGG